MWQDDLKMLSLFELPTALGYQHQSLPGTAEQGGPGGPAPPQ